MCRTDLYAILVHSIPEKCVTFCWIWIYRNCSVHLHGLIMTNETHCWIVGWIVRNLHWLIHCGQMLGHVKSLLPGHHHGLLSDYWILFHCFSNTWRLDGLLVITQNYQRGLKANGDHSNACGVGLLGLLIHWDSLQQILLPWVECG